MKAKLIVISSLTVLVLLIVFSMLFSLAEIEKDLLDESKKALTEEGIYFEGLEFDGQQAILKGIIASQEEKDQIEKIVSAIPGVATISNNLIVRVAIAVIVRVSGENTIVNALNGKSTIAKNGGRLADGDIITTAKTTGRVELKFLDDNSMLRMRPNSSCTIRTTQEKNTVAKNILLEFGTILSKVVQQKSSFIVTTPTSLAAVKGTSFWSLQEFNGPTSFLGEEGIVEISNDAGVVLMKAGEMCSIISKTSKLIVEKIDLRKAFLKTVGESKIIFDQSGFILNQEQYNFLNKVKDFMNKYPNAVIEIEGYTDAVGSANLNLILSKQRANAARDYLIKEGVDPESLLAKGYGEMNPIANNYSKEGRRKNRRVEFKVKENK